jgi:hypothetical protein
MTVSLMVGLLREGSDLRGACEIRLDAGNQTRSVRTDQALEEARVPIRQRAQTFVMGRAS